MEKTYTQMQEQKSQLEMMAFTDDLFGSVRAVKVEEKIWFVGRDVVEDLVEKFRYDTKICSRLKKHIEEFDNLNSDALDNSNGLAYYLEKVGVNPRTSFSPNEVEKSFAEKLSSNEYANLVLDHRISYLLEHQILRLQLYL